MAQLVQVDRGLDFEVIVDEFRAQLPLNTGRLEWDLLTGAPENHPVIAFERAVLSLPMTLPAEFTASIEREADRVYAEFEALSEIGDGVSMAELVGTLTARDSVDVSSRSDVEGIVTSLADKGLVVWDGETIETKRFETVPE